MNHRDTPPEMEFFEKGRPTLGEQRVVLKLDELELVIIHIQFAQVGQRVVRIIIQFGNSHPVNVIGYCFGRDEFQRIGPVAPPPRIVLHPGASPISMTDLETGGIDGNGIAKPIQFAALPDRRDFIVDRGLRVIRRSRGIGDFTNAPLQSAKRAVALRVLESRCLQP